MRIFRKNFYSHLQTWIREKAILNINYVVYDIGRKKFRNHDNELPFFQPDTPVFIREENMTDKLEKKRISLQKMRIWKVFPEDPPADAAQKQLWAGRGSSELMKTSVPSSRTAGNSNWMNFAFHKKNWSWASAFAFMMIFSR